MICYFIKGTEPSETSQRFAKLAAPTNLSVVETTEGAVVSWDSPKVPDVSTDEYLQKYFKTNYGKYSEKYYNLRTQYNNTYMGSFGFDVYLRTGDTLKYVGHTEEPSFVIKNSAGYDAVVVKTAYSIFKSNQSDEVSKELSGKVTTVNIELLALDGHNKIHPTLKIGDVLPELGISTIKVIANDIDVTDTIDTSTVTMTIKNRITNETVSSLSDINLTEKGWYQITYNVTYLGVTYTSEPRSIYIE